MVVRSDLTFNWASSPRLITVQSPSTEITIQDLVDTCRNEEQKLQNLGYDRLIDAAGKEPLGGGVLVGITATLLNAQLAFEARPGPDFVLCTISGGNLVAEDDLGSIIDPRSPTAFVTIDRTSSSSATLQDLESLQAASFDGAVALDVNSSFSGTLFPVGTRQNPVNNLADARSICIERGLRTIVILSDTTTLTVGDFSDGYTFIGESPIITTVTIDAATNVTNCRFQNMFVQGTLDNNNEFRECIVGDISFFNGGLLQCALVGTITLAGGVQAQIYDSWSGIADHSANNYAEINLGGTGQDLVLRNYTGGVRLTNSTGPANVSMDITSGRVFLEPSITDGDIEIRGNARVQNNSTGTTIVRNETLNQAQELAAFEGKVTVDPIGGTTGEYEYPYGTPGSPVLTLADANTIASRRGITEIAFLSSYTFLSGDDVSDKLLSGRGPGTVLTFQSGSVTTRTNFQACTVEGTISAFGNFNFCHFRDVLDTTTGAHALVQFQQCSFDSTWTFSSAHIASMELLYCVTGATAKSLNAGRASFDFNGADVDVAFRNYSGSMEISGISNALADVSVDFFSGSVLVDATNTDGQLILRGDAIITDFSTGTAVTNATIHEAVEASAFGGYVTVDETNLTGAAVAGTIFPAGTDESPSNNIEDTMTIARERGLVEMRVIGPLVVDGSNNIEGMTLFCRLVGSSVQISDSAEVNRVAFLNLAIFNSTLEERSSFADCFVFNCTSLRARLRKCGLSQTITLSGGGTTVLEDCYSGYPLGQNNAVPAVSTIDLGGSGQSLRVVGWRGNLVISNLTDAAEYAEIDAELGNITIDSSVTAGSIVIRGGATVTDNSTGTAVVTVDASSLTAADVAEAVWAEDLAAASAGAGKYLKDTRNNSSATLGLVG